MTVPTISVLIASYTEKRWEQLRGAVDSALDQSRPPDEIIIGVDHNPALLDRIKAEIPEVRTTPNTGERGASGARNSAAAISTGDILVFFDDDALADRRWLENLVRPLEDPAVIGVGGRTDALWHFGEPKWLPPEFLWIVGAHYRGMRDDSGPIRNVWSGNLAIRRSDFERAGGFRSGFGKLGNVSRPEDTEFCLRVAQLSPGSHWVYQVDALNGHQLPAGRETFGFFVRRCWAEGRGKADLARLDSSGNALSSERSYAAKVLPGGIVTGVRDQIRGRDRYGLAKSGAIVVGAGTAVAGLLTGRVLELTKRGRADRTEHAEPA